MSRSFLSSAERRATDGCAFEIERLDRQLWSAPMRSQALDVAIIGSHLSRCLPLGCRPTFLHLWRRCIVPEAIHLEWQFGATVLIHGLRAAPHFNGLIGRISSHKCSTEGRWEVLIANGPGGVGTADLRPANLAAPPSVADVLTTHRRLPPIVQVPPKRGLITSAAFAKVSPMAAIALNGKSCPPCKPHPSG